MSLLKRIFGIRRANKGTDDPQVDFEVKELKKGYILDYDMTSWEVKDVATYTWDNGVKDLEFEIFDGKRKQFLNYESATEQLSIYWEASIEKVWAELPKLIREKSDISLHTFKYSGDTWSFKGTGAARVTSTRENWEMENWLFGTANGRMMSFNRYSDGLIEAYEGKLLKTYEVSNILKR